MIETRMTFMKRILPTSIAACCLSLFCANVEGAVIDGINDFQPSSTYATSGGASNTGYASLSTTFLHFGFDSPDVSSGGSQHFAVAYIGTTGSSTPGINFNTQQPTINFAASHAFIIRLDAGYKAVLAWNGSSWNTTTIVMPTAESGNFLEAAVNAADIGSPTSLLFTGYMLYEGAGFESSFNVFPSNSFSNGTYDPNLTTSIPLAVPEPGVAWLGLMSAGVIALRRRRSAKRPLPPL